MLRTVERSGTRAMRLCWIYMGLAELFLDLVEPLTSMAALLDSPLLIAGLLLVVTAGAIGLCIPGLLMPISFSAGLMLDNWLAVSAVAAGAALGSHGLFVAARYGLGGAVERRISGQLDRFLPHLERYGLAYVVGLRVVGTPHALVTVASAASPLPHGRFALATLIGFLPAIIVAAGAGNLF